jgi:methyl-accepting chemotaxis protein
MTKPIALHVPIAAKAVLLIAALGLMSIAANWFCLQQFDAINALNVAVTREVAPARLALAEAKAALESFGVAVYKTYSASDADQARESAAAIEGEYQAAKSALNNVLTYDPALSEDVGRIFDKLELAHGVALDLTTALKAGAQADAQRIVDFKLDPARDDVAFQMNRLINILGGQARDAETEAAERGGWIYRLTIGILAAGTAAALIGAFLLSHLFIARPLRRIAANMTRMANGDLGVTIPGARRSDEIGAMARAVEVFRSNAIALREAERARTIERQRAEQEKDAALDAVAGAIETDILTIAAHVEQSATELETFARGMMTGLEESRRHAGMATSVAGETTASAAGVAAAIEELSTSIGEISAQVANASSTIAEATRCTGSAMSNTSALVTTVEDIDQIATMITAIASKTNLLALNAAIEAARAGEAGRGFAVVAQEVKALATQTTNALADIKQKTTSVGQVIEQVRAATQAMSSSMQKVEEISDAISISVEQQDLAARKIAESVDGAAQRTRQVSSAIADVSELVSQSGRGADQVLAAAAELNRQAAALCRDARSFTERIRAA